MKKLPYKTLAIIISCILICSGGVAAVATSSTDKNTKAAVVTQLSDTKDSVSDGKNTKTETVYVISDATGKPSNVISSNWIKNKEKSDSVADISDLSDIVNVKSDFTFKDDGSKKNWDAKGNDIYYKGNSQKELPVTMSVKYTLDGADITPEELAGKSGKVTIEYTFINNNKSTVNGKEVYVPYAAIAGTLLDNAVFTDVEVENGKLINDGDKSIVAGIMFPSLNANLGLTTSVYKLPETMKITADVKEFKLEGSAAVVTNEIFNNIDTSKLSSVDNLDTTITSVKSNVTTLVDGVNALYSGLQELQGKSKEFVSGVNTLSGSTKQLADGGSDLYNGSKKLDDGLKNYFTEMGKLNDGLSQIEGDGNSKALQAGAKQVYDQLLAQATSGLKSAKLTVPDLTISNYTEVLNQLIAELDKDNTYKKVLAGVTQKVNEKKSLIESTATAKVKEAVKQQVTQVMPDGTSQEQINAVVEQKMATDGIKAQIATITDAQIKSLISEAMQGEEAQKNLSAAAAGLKQVSSLKSSLDSYNYFYTSLISYTDGVKEAADGCKKLSSYNSELLKGSSDLKAGAYKLFGGTAALNDGAAKLNAGATQLQGGINQLTDGAGQLKAGLDKAMAEVMTKLSNLDEEKIKTAINGISDSVKASKGYTSFSGKSNDMNGSVKFIYRTEGIEKKNK